MESLIFPEENVVYTYKYLPFDEGSLKVITDGTIRFSSPLEFNDPFDCISFYDPANVSNLHRYRSDLFRNAAKAKGLSPAKRIMQRGPAAARLRRVIESGKFARDLLSDVSVVCLSRIATSILMWSHYANFHSGFVVEFRTPIRSAEARDAGKERVLGRLLAHPVSYSASRPRVAVATTPSKTLVDDVFLTKSDVWSYEEEVRVVGYDRKPGIYPYFRDEILCSVIAGMRMSDDGYSALRNAVEAVQSQCINEVLLYRATPSANEYALNIPNHPRIESPPVI